MAEKILELFAVLILGVIIGVFAFKKVFEYAMRHVPSTRQAFRESIDQIEREQAPQPVAQPIVMIPAPILDCIQTDFQRVLKERDQLWQLLDNIDTLDDACRERDDKFRELSRVHLKKRFEILLPSANDVLERPG